MTKKLLSAFTAAVLFLTSCLTVSFAAADTASEGIENFESQLVTPTQSVSQTADGLLFSGYGTDAMAFAYYNTEKLAAPTEKFSVSFQVTQYADEGQLAMIGLLSDTGWNGFATQGSQHGLFLIVHPTTGVVELHEKKAGEATTQLMAVDISPYMDTTGVMKFEILEIGGKYYFCMNGQGIDRGYVNGEEASFILSDHYDLSALADGCYLTVGGTNFLNNKNDRISLLVTEVNGKPYTGDSFAEGMVGEADFTPAMETDNTKISFGADGAYMLGAGGKEVNFSYYINKKFRFGETGFSTTFNIERATSDPQQQIMVAMLDGKGWKGYEDMDATGGLMLWVQPDTMVMQLYSKNGGRHYQQICAFDANAYAGLNQRIKYEIKKNAAGKYNVFINGTEITQAYVKDVLVDFVLEDHYDLSVHSEGFYATYSSVNLGENTGESMLRVYDAGGFAVADQTDFAADNFQTILNPEYFPQKMTVAESGYFFESSSANTNNFSYYCANAVPFPAEFSTEFSLVSAADGGQLGIIALSDRTPVGSLDDGLPWKGLMLLVHPDTMVIELYAKNGNQSAVQLLAAEARAYIQVGKHIRYEIKKNAQGKYNLFLNGQEFNRGYVGGVMSDFVLEDAVDLNAYFPNGAYFAVNGLNQTSNPARQCIAVTEINGVKLAKTDFAFDSTKLVNKVNAGSVTLSETSFTLSGANRAGTNLTYLYNEPTGFPGAGFSTTIQLQGVSANQLAIVALMSNDTWTGFEDTGSSNGLMFIMHPDSRVIELYVKVGDQKAQLLAYDASAMIGTDLKVKLELKENSAGKLSLFINGTEVTQGYVNGNMTAYLLENSFYYPMLAEKAYAYYSVTNFANEANETKLIVSEMNGKVASDPVKTGFELDKLISGTDPVVAPAAAKFLTKEGLVLVGKGTPRENFRFSYADAYDCSAGFDIQLAMTSFADYDMHFAFVLTDEEGWAGWDENDRNGLLVIFVNNSPTHLAVYNLTAGEVPEQVFITDEFICAKGDVLDVAIDNKSLVINGKEIKAYSDNIDDINTSVLEDSAYLSLAGFNFNSDKTTASRLVVSRLMGEELSGDQTDSVYTMTDDALNLSGNPALTADDFKSTLDGDAFPNAGRYLTEGGLTLYGRGTYRENFMYTVEKKLLFPQSDFTMEFTLDQNADEGQLYSLTFSDIPGWTGWNYESDCQGFVLFFKPFESAVEIHSLTPQETPVKLAYVPNLTMKKGDTVRVSFKKIDGVVRLFINGYDIPEFVQYRDELGMDVLAEGSYLTVGGFNFSKNLIIPSQISIKSVNENTFEGEETIPGMEDLVEDSNAPEFNFDHVILVNPEATDATKSLTENGLILNGKNYPDMNFIYGISDKYTLENGFSMEFTLDKWDVAESGQSFGVVLADRPFWTGYNYDNEHTGFMLLFQPQQKGISLCTLYPEEQPVPMGFVDGFVYEPGMKIKLEIKNEGGLYELYINDIRVQEFSDVSGLLGVDELFAGEVYLTFAATNLNAAMTEQQVTIHNLLGRRLSGNIPPEHGDGHIDVDDPNTPDTGVDSRESFAVILMLLAGAAFVWSTKIRRHAHEK